jgi:hypothetical protein
MIDLRLQAKGFEIGEKEDVIKLHGEKISEI